MLVLLYRDDERNWFTLYSVFVGAAVLLSTAHAAAYGGSSWLRALLTLFGLHHCFNAALSIRKDEKSDKNRDKEDVEEGGWVVGEGSAIEVGATECRNASVQR